MTFIDRIADARDLAEVFDLVNEFISDLHRMREIQRAVHPCDLKRPAIPRVGPKSRELDRLLAVPVTPVNGPAYGAIDDLPENSLHELEHFFKSYNAAQGRGYNIIGRAGPDAAEQASAQAESSYLDRKADE